MERSHGPPRGRPAPVPRHPAGAHRGQLLPPPRARVRLVRRRRGRGARAADAAAVVADGEGASDGARAGRDERRRVVTRRRPNLYTVARTVNTLSALASGDPGRIARRARNVAVGRMLARGGAWRRLWLGGR